MSEKHSHDAVNSPSHYAAGKIEVIEFIEDQGFGPGFTRGNAIKYIARAGKKDPGKEIEDLEKARWYIDREIERLRAVKEGRDPVRPNAMNPKKDGRTAPVPVPSGGRPLRGSPPMEIKVPVRHRTLCTNCGGYFSDHDLDTSACPPGKTKSLSHLGYISFDEVCLRCGSRAGEHIGSRCKGEGRTDELGTFLREPGVFPEFRSRKNA